jgi:hypothetical protein
MGTPSKFLRAHQSDFSR